MRLIVRVGQLEHVLDVEMEDLEPGMYYRSSHEPFFPEDENPPWRKSSNNWELPILLGRHLQVMELEEDAEGRIERKL